MSGQNNISFKGMWKNRTVLKSLETISEHGASFGAGVSFVMASAVRPISISMTPNVKKENKEYAVTNSIASGAVKFALLETVALPFENIIKKLENNPKKFLNKNTIDSFSTDKKKLNQSRKFKFITQLMKQSIGVFTAIPKSMITVALIPVLTNKLYKKNEMPQVKNEYKPAFKGKYTDKAAKKIGKIFEKKSVQHFADKYFSKDKDIARDMAISTDVLLSSSFAIQTSKSRKIDEQCKKPLIVNNFLGTGISILGGYSVDKLVKNNTKDFIEEFKELNKNDPKLLKYIEGINIVRPTLIFAAIYYGILPSITTYIADKTGK